VRGGDVDLGDDLPLTGPLEQRGKQGETALWDGREEQAVKLREARCFGDDHPHQGRVAQLAHQREELAGQMGERLMQRGECIGCGQRRELLGKRRLLQCRVAQLSAKRASLLAYLR